MTGLLAALRGLLHRAGISLNILLVAVVAVAAVSIGPAYYAAAQSSVVQDTVGTAPAPGRGLEVAQSGSVDAVNGVAQQAQGLLAHYLGGPATLHRLFGPPVLAAETTVQAGGQTIPLVYRTGVCAHLRFTSGHCPRAPREVAVSQSLAFLLHWHTGQRVAVPTWGHLVITGQYQITVTAAGTRYWFEAGSRYFPYETAYGPNRPGTPYDAMFTPLATMGVVPGAVQGTDYADFSLLPAHLTGPDVALVQTAVTGLTLNRELTNDGATTTTSLPATLGTVRASWRAILVPVVLITAQLLLLAWLLLFLIVADAAEARGPEVALAKMRGRGRWRSLTFALGEPVILLAVALPVGVLAGWAITTGLGHILFRPGTPVALPAASWLAAAVATAGGVAAVAATARRTLSRSVVEQWQRASRGAAQRGWVLDAILITAAVAGLIELRVSGQIGSARRGVLGLLLPGLLGIAVAVAASRLLIIACRAGFRSTRSSGRIGPFLALRHVARRPGGMRTTIVLATAFALAGFAAGIWSVSVANIRAVADARVGAATVLSVVPPAGHSLAAIVDRIDPGGRQAMAVDEYTNLSGSSAGQVLMAVDPPRFAHIAAWRPDWADGRPLSSLTSALHPPAPPPVVLHGSQVRVRFRARGIRPAGGTLVLDVYEQGVGAVGQTSVYLGPVSGSRSATAQLTGCPCLLANVTIFAPATIGTRDQPDPDRRIPHPGQHRRPVRPWPVGAGRRRAEHARTMAVERDRERNLAPRPGRPGLDLQVPAGGESRREPRGPAVPAAGPGGAGDTAQRHTRGAGRRPGQQPAVRPPGGHRRGHPGRARQRCRRRPHICGTGRGRDARLRQPAGVAGAGRAGPGAPGAALGPGADQRDDHRLRGAGAADPAGARAGHRALPGRCGGGRRAGRWRGHHRPVRLGPQAEA